jgi:hypothetical protein
MHFADDRIAGRLWRLGVQDAVAGGEESALRGAVESADAVREMLQQSGNVRVEFGRIAWQRELVELDDGANR